MVEFAAPSRHLECMYVCIHIAIYPLRVDTCTVTPETLSLSLSIHLSLRPIIKQICTIVLNDAAALHKADVSRKPLRNRSNQDRVLRV
jgi:hypothetical protein